MKRIFTILLLLTYSYTNRQTKDFTVKYQVFYIKNNTKIVDDICELYINKNESYFYSFGAIENRKHIEQKLQKIMASGGTNINFDQNELKSTLYPFKIIKKYNDRKAIICEEIGGQNLGFVKDSLSIKRWDITNQKKYIGKYICYKAQMKKDTSLLTAWFCKDIPINEGPFYFFGLPGLILQASSTSGWNANVISTSSAINTNYKYFTNNYILVTEEKIRKAKKNNNRDFVEGIQSNGDLIEKAKN